MTRFLARSVLAVILCVAVAGPALAQADLSIALYAEPGGTGTGGSGSTPVAPPPVTPGGRQFFVLVVRNNGPNAAGGVVATMTFPQRTSLYSFSGGTAVCASSIVSGHPTVTCSRASLPRDEAFLASVSLQLETDYPWQNGLPASASVSSAVPDPDLSNNTASVSVYVRPPAGAAVAPTLSDVSLVVLAALLALVALVRTR